MTFLIEMTLQVTVTALLILLIKFIFGRKMSSKQHLYIWLILVVRIMFPVLPEQPFSIYNWLNLEQIGIYSQEAIMINSDHKETEGTFDELSLSETRDMTTRKTNTQMNNKTNEIAQNLEHSENGFISSVLSVDKLITGLWKLGILFLNLYFVSIYLILRRKISRIPAMASGMLLEEVNLLKEKIGIKQKVSLVEFGEMPMMIGFWRPIILIKPRQIKEGVLIHELVHFKHRDMWWNALACLALSIQWYNPLIWYCFFRAKMDIEMHCDEDCILILEHKREYAQMLLEQASKISKGHRSYPVLMTKLGSGKRALKMRLQFIAKLGEHKKAYKWVGVIMIGVVALLCLGNAVRGHINVQERIIAQNTIRFIDKIKALEIGSYNDLKDLTPFDWDRLVCIPPYMSASEAQSKYGFTYDAKMSVSEGMPNWVFLEGEQVVAYICGYPPTVPLSSRFQGEIGPSEPFYFVRMEEDYNGLILYEVNCFYGYSDAYKAQLNVYPYKSAYIGDASNAFQMAHHLLYGEFITGISLETLEIPYGLQVDYQYFGEINASIDADLIQNAMMIFALIDNVDQVKFRLDLKGPNESELDTVVSVYDRQEMDEKAGKSLKAIGASQESFDAFFKIGEN